MSYKFSFADNATYSATDVNAITKRLVASGIEDSFTDGVAYNMSKFNEAGKLLYTSGVVPEYCMTLKVEITENVKIVINPGVAFFDDGAVIEINEGGETLSLVEGTKNYVYLKNDLINTNRCYPYCGTQAPEGDFVLLAEIDENGTITDKRTYAKGRLPGYQSVVGQVLYFKENIEITMSTTSSYSGSGRATFDIGPNNFDYVLAADFADDADTSRCLSLMRLSDGKMMSAWEVGSDNHFGNTFYESAKGVGETLELTTLSLSKEGKLTIEASLSSERYISEKGSTFTVPVNLIFF